MPSDSSLSLFAENQFRITFSTDFVSAGTLTPGLT